MRRARATASAREHAPALDGGQPPGVEPGVPVPGDELSGAVDIARRCGVVDRLAHLARGAKPGSRPPVQLGYPVWFGDPELVLEQLTEEAVITKPVPFGVQGDQEQVGSLDALQRDRAIRPAGHRLAQRRRQPGQDRGLQQECVQVSLLRCEHLGAEEIEHEAVGAVELRDECGPVGVVPQGQPRPVQPGGPALGAGGQPPDISDVQA